MYRECSHSIQYEISLLRRALDFIRFLNNLDIMLKKHFTEVKEEHPNLAGTKGCTVQWLISQEQGAVHYAMRLFTLQPGGIIPLHEHEVTEHEIFIVEGGGIINDGVNEISVKRGDAVFVEAGEKHSFVNNGDLPLQFICVIPL